MTTIGYGDFSPKTEIEMLFIALFALIASGVFGYGIN